MFSTDAGYFFTNSPVKKIWNANPTAQRSVRPSPRLSVRFPFKESSATPITDMIAPMIPFMPTFFFKIINAMNGTIPTFSAVRNAFLEGVVYCRPII